MAPKVAPTISPRRLREFLEGFCASVVVGINPTVVSISSLVNEVKLRIISIVDMLGSMVVEFCTSIDIIDDHSIDASVVSSIITLFSLLEIIVTKPNTTLFYETLVNKQYLNT